MKKNKLYTVNRWNKPAFMPEENLFLGGGGFWNGGNSGFVPFDSDAAAKDVELVRGIQFNPSQANTSFSGGLSLNQQIARDGYNPGTMKQQIDSLTTPSNNSGSTKSVSVKPTTMQAIGMASNFMDTIPTGDKRGMWDTLDPVYHLAGGRESGAGNAMSDAGVALTKSGLQSGQPYMALAGAALKVIGGLTNAAFGIKENKERKKVADASINTNRNFVSNATSFDDIKGPAAKVGTNIYEGGWFSGGKARDKNEQYARDMANAFNWADASVTNNAYNIFSDKIGDALRNYSAFGGPLEITDNNDMGAIEYDFMSDYLANKKKQTEQKNSINNMFAGTPASMFAIGGDMEAVQDNTRVYKPLVLPVNREHNFTDSEYFWDAGREYPAGLWRHKDGTFHTTGSYGKDIVLTQEEADSIIRAQEAKNRKERFRKAIKSQRQGNIDNTFAFGGDLQTNGADFSTGAAHIGAGGSHEENPYDGVQLGVDNEGVPNLVEEGEVVFNDYVFSKRIGLDQAAKERFHFPRKKDITYADAAKRLEKEIAERPNDPISKASFKAQMEQLEEQQERQKAEMEAARAREAFEALSPEEQTALMQQRAEQEQMDQEAAQQQAMQEQAMAEQSSPEEAAMMQQQMMPEEQGIPMEGYAYGGNLFDEGGYKGALAWLKKNRPNIKNAEAVAKVMANRVGRGSYTGYRGSDPNNKVYFWNKILNDMLPSNSMPGKANEELFKSLVADGMDKELAFEFSIPKELGYPYDSDKQASQLKAYRDAAYTRLVTNGASASGAQKVQRGKTIRWRSVDPNDTKVYATEKEAKEASARYNLAQRDARRAAAAEAVQPQSTQTPALVQETTTPITQSSTNVSTQGAQSTAGRTGNRGRVASGRMNAGTWINGGAAENWNRYTRNGLRDFLMKVNEDIDNADTEEKKNEIRENAIKTVRGIQQAYSEAYQNNLTPSEVNEKVRALQTAFQNAGGNAYFYDIADNINLPQGHNTEDTEEKGWVDGLWGPRTSIRNWGSTEYGDDYNDIKELAQRAGMTYAPGQFKYGDNTLYELGMAQPEVVAAQEEEPEAAWDYGDPSIQSTETPENSGSVATDGKPVDERGIVANHRNDKLRYAGLLGPAVGLGMMAAGIGKPDTSGIDAAVNAGRGPAVLANWKPIGDYMAYKPNDPWFYTAPIIAQSNATQRSINNTTAPSRNAASLANAYNTMIALGKAQREQLDSNYGRYAQSKEFNRGTNQFNAQAYNQNQQFNADAQNRARQYGASLAMQGAAQKMAADANWYGSMYGNVAGLFKGLGELGRENYQYNQMVDLLGTGALPGVTEDRLVKSGLYKYAKKAKEGGKVKRKKGKRGLTI